MSKLDNEYWTSMFKYQGKIIKVYVHVIVWECFNQRVRQLGYVIHHKDNNRSNARENNLEEITTEENLHGFNRKLN